MGWIAWKEVNMVPSLEWLGFVTEEISVWSEWIAGQSLKVTLSNSANLL